MQVNRICLTPTRNGEWIIPHFLRAAAMWADRIIVADQGSDDRTREYVDAAERAELIVNDSPEYDEAYRTKLLLRSARQSLGKRILLALDADEALSSNVKQSHEWARIENAPPGTILRFRWVNILPGFEQAWIPSNRIACGYVDDGVEHSGVRIHSPRVPNPDGAPVLDLNDIVVLHFQYLLPARTASKQRWYQAWESVQYPGKGPLQIFRQYNHMHGGWAAHELEPVKESWLAGFRDSGADFASLACEPVTWWDREILRLFQLYGTEKFSRIAIWERDWREAAQIAGLDGALFHDPRSPLEKLAHQLLRATQGSRDRIFVRGIEKLLRFAGW